jgi:hypothetical protein
VNEGECQQREGGEIGHVVSGGSRMVPVRTDWSQLLHRVSFDDLFPSGGILKSMKPLFNLFDFLISEIFDGSVLVL